MCNDLSLMWDVKIRDDPILLRHLSGEIKVYVTKKVKLECQNGEGVPQVLELNNTPYIPQAKVNFFSLQKMRKAHYRVTQKHKVGTQWIQNESG